MDPDDFEEFVLSQQPQPQQKVIVQRNSPILFPCGGPLTLNATSSLLVPNSVPIQAQPPPPPTQLSFGTATTSTIGGPSSLVDATSVIVLNKDSSLSPMAIPINVVTAATAEQPQQQPSNQFMQKVVMAAAGPSGTGSVQLVPAGTMKTLQQKVSDFIAISCIQRREGESERDCFSRYVPQRRRRRC